MTADTIHSCPPDVTDGTFYDANVQVSFTSKQVLCLMQERSNLRLCDFFRRRPIQLALWNRSRSSHNQLLVRTGPWFSSGLAECRVATEAIINPIYLCAVKSDHSVNVTEAFRSAHTISIHSTAEGLSVRLFLRFPSFELSSVFLKFRH